MAPLSHQPEMYLDYSLCHIMAKCKRTTVLGKLCLREAANDPDIVPSTNDVKMMLPETCHR